MSRDKITSVTWHFVQQLNSRAIPFLITAVLYSVQLRCENAVNADWSILVYATKLQCATRHVTLVILSRDKVARQNCAIKLHVWHRSYINTGTTNFASARYIKPTLRLVEIHSITAVRCISSVCIFTFYTPKILKLSSSQLGLWHRSNSVDTGTSVNVAGRPAGRRPTVLVVAGWRRGLSVIVSFSAFLLITDV